MAQIRTEPESKIWRLTDFGATRSQFFCLPHLWWLYRKCFKYSCWMRKSILK